MLLLLFAAITWFEQGLSKKPAVCSARVTESPLQIPHYKLVQLQLVMRHGARSPYHNLPNQTNPHRFMCDLHGAERSQANLWSQNFKVIDVAGEALDPQPPLESALTQADGHTCPPGGLMEEGVRQCRNIGFYLLKSYRPLLSELSVDNTYVRAMDIPRVLLSSVSLLSTMLLASPRALRQRFPVVIERNSKQEAMNGLDCPRGSLLKIRQDKAFQYPPKIVSDLGHIFGIRKPASILRTVDPAIADVTYTALCDGSDQLPCGPAGCMNISLQKTLEGYYDKKWCNQFTGAQGGQESSELLMYPFIKEIVDRMSLNFTSEAVPGKHVRPRLAVYVGRDLVIGPVAAALGFFDCRWPPFAAHILFELWEPVAKRKDMEPMVRVIFDGEPVTSKVRGCKGMDLCSLADLQRAVEGLLGEYSTHAKACAVSLETSDPADTFILPVQAPELILFTFVSFLAVAAIIISKLDLTFPTQWRHRQRSPIHFQEALLLYS